MKKDNSDIRPEKWSPWGPAFADKPYVQVPHTVFAALSAMKPVNFNAAEKIVVIAFASFVFPSSPDIHQVSLTDLKNRSNSGISTVQRTIQKMKANGLVVVSEHSFKNYQRTVYNSSAFFKKLKKTADLLGEPFHYDE